MAWCVFCGGNKGAQEWRDEALKVQDKSCAVRYPARSWLDSEQAECPPGWAENVDFWIRGKKTCEERPWRVELPAASGELGGSRSTIFDHNAASLLFLIKKFSMKNWKKADRQCNTDYLSIA